MSPELKQAYELVEADLRSRGVGKIELLGEDRIVPNYWRVTIPEAKAGQWVLSQDESLSEAIDPPASGRTT